MFPNWELVSLEDVGVTLIDCVHKTPKAVDQGLPYITIPEMKNGWIDLQAARKITESDFAEWTQKALPRVGDVVLSRRCNPGVIAPVRHEAQFALGQNLVLLRSNAEKVYPKYLGYLCESQEWWKQVNMYLNVGATFDSLKCVDIPKFVMPIPPLAEQKAIAHILGTLDDKIELNRQTNKTLEDIARAIFKSWFVDFDPVRYKRDGKIANSDGKTPYSLNREILDLFPDKFQDSELGEIPEGWGVVPLYNTARFINGAAFKANQFCEFGTGLPIVKIVELKNGISANTKYTTREVPEKNHIYTGDLLYSWSGSPETSLETFLWNGGHALLNQHI